MMCARPISSSRALLRVCTREPTQCKRLPAGVLTILWAIDLYKFLLSWMSAKNHFLCQQATSSKLANIIAFLKTEVRRLSCISDITGDTDKNMPNGSPLQFIFKI